LRPAAFFWAVVPPCEGELFELPECEFLPPRLDAPGEFAIFAARSLDIPLSLSASYCFSFLTLARLFGMPALFQPRRAENAVSQERVAASWRGMKRYRLIGRDGLEVVSDRPGTLGGHRRSKVYGRLDCPSALRWIARGHYVRHRVFFADEETAVAAGYRPCANCLPAEYAVWKASRARGSLPPPPGGRLPR
jgi:hypothetical protein